MKKRFDIRGAAICVTALAALNLCGIAVAQDAEVRPNASKIKGVAAGSDFLETAQGTQSNLGGTVVQLKGVPIPGMGSADTQIVRQKEAGALDDASPDFLSIPIQMVSLNMTGSLGACTVNVTLAPSPASTGTMTIMPNAAGTGGTFSSTLTVHYIAMFTPAATCPKTTKSYYKFNQKGGTWSTTPQPGAFVVSGPYGNPNVNQHAGLPPGIVDFYISGTGSEAARTAQHVVCAAFAAAGTPCP